MKLNLRKLGDAAVMDAEGTPDELAKFASLLIAPPRNNGPVRITISGAFKDKAPEHRATIEALARESAGSATFKL